MYICSFCVRKFNQPFFSILERQEKQYSWPQNNCIVVPVSLRVSQIAAFRWKTQMAKFVIPRPRKSPSKNMNHFSMTPLFKDGCTFFTWLWKVESNSHIILCWFRLERWVASTAAASKKTMRYLYKKQSPVGWSTENLGLSSWTFYLGLQQSESTFHRPRLNDV